MEPQPTLQSILTSRRIPRSSLEVKCPEKHVVAITKSITRWKELSPFLGLSRQDEDDIEADNSKNAERRIAMMRRWSEKFGEEATYYRLVEAFETLQWRHCICDLLDLFQETLRTESVANPGPGDGAQALQSSSTSPLGNDWHTAFSYACKLPTVYTLHLLVTVTLKVLP